MLSCSIKESGKFEFVLGIFPIQLQSYLIFSLIQSLFTYADASSILILPLEHLSRKVSVFPELTVGSCP